MTSSEGVMSKLARHTRFSYYVAGNHFESRQTACPDHGTRVAHRCNTFSCIIIINVFIIRDVFSVTFLEAECEIGEIFCQPSESPDLPRISLSEVSRESGSGRESEKCDGMQR